MKYQVGDILRDPLDGETVLIFDIKNGTYKFTTLVKSSQNRRLSSTGACSDMGLSGFQLIGKQSMFKQQLKELL